MAAVTYTKDTENKCTVSPGSITTSTRTVTITAKDGFYFENPFNNGKVSDALSPRLTFRFYLSFTESYYYINTNDELTNNDIITSRTLSDDKKTITFNINLAHSNGTFKSVKCEIEPEHPILSDTPSYLILTLTKNLTNVTMSPDVNSIEIDGTSKIITLTANSGYQFSDVPKLTISGTDYNFILSNDVYTLDVNTLNIDSDVSGTITATGTAIPLSKNVTNSLTNCYVIPDFNVMIENTTYNLTLNANKGFKFVSTPTLKINNRNRTELDFIKVTDYQYTLSFTAISSYFDTNTNAVLSGTAIEETPIVNKYGAIQVYNPSISDMTELATKRFKQNGTVGGVTYSDIDLGNYITQFKRVFFNFEKSSKQNILLGANDTLINTDTILNDDVTIDCGTVFIQGTNNNELDTKIYKIKIVLPFYEVIELPSIYMNKTIHIVYQCNVITGYADILINEVVNNTDLLIIKYRCKISQDLPYILNYDKLNGALSDMQLNTSPKIILQKNNIFIDKGYNTFKESLISNESGYFEVKDIISMSINATQKEKDLIENLLKSGVYI